MTRKRQYDQMVERSEIDAEVLVDMPLHFELCAWQADQNWHLGSMPAIVLASTDEEPYGKGHAKLRSDPY